MNIIERGRSFVQKVRELARRVGMGLATLSPMWRDVDAQERGAIGVIRGHWRGGRRCAYSVTGVTRAARSIQRGAGVAGAGSWYASGCTSLCRGPVGAWAEFVTAGGGVLAFADGSARALVAMAGMEEESPGAGDMHLHHSTVQRWLDGAGQKAEKSVAGQMAGISILGADGHGRAVGAATWREQAGGVGVGG